jgi:bacteriocin-like protein
MSEEKKIDPGSPQTFVQPEPEELSEAELNSVSGGSGGLGCASTGSGLDDKNLCCVKQ